VLGPRSSRTPCTCSPRPAGLPGLRLGDQHVVEAPEAVAFALKLKQLGNRIQDLVGGRAIHRSTRWSAASAGCRREALRSIRDDLRASLDR